jgi:hypothetical protein
VPLEKIEVAREALLRELKSKHAKVVEAINTGDKVSDKDNETVLKVAHDIAKQYEVKEAKK